VDLAISDRTSAPPLCDRVERVIYVKLTGNELSRKAIIEETDWNAVKWNGKESGRG
jgi:hypothetical protein